MGRRVAPGTLQDYAGGTVLYGWLLCDGSAYNASTSPIYQALFNRIGNLYGGVDNTDFQVPDFRRRVAMGSGGTAISGPANTVGSTGGEETHQLSASESGLVGHTHGLNDPGHSHATSPQAVGVGGGLFTNTGNQTGSNAVVQPSGTGITLDAVASSSASSAHNTVQPSLVCLKIIKW